MSEPTVRPVVVPTVAVELPGGRSLFACRYEEPTTGRDLVSLSVGWPSGPRSSDGLMVPASCLPKLVAALDALSELEGET